MGADTGGVGIERECVGFSRGGERGLVLDCRTGETTRGGNEGVEELKFVSLGGDVGVGEAEASLTGRLA